MQKYFITAQQLLQDSWQLARQILQSDYRPDFIVGIWRGGTPVAIAMHEYLAYKGVATEHSVIQTASYQSIGVQSNTINMSLLEPLLERLKPNSRLLLIDDVFDTGRTLQAVVSELKRHQPEAKIKTACPWYKPSNRQVELLPDYYLRTTDKWLVFPHELAGHSSEELIAARPELADFL